MNCEMSMYIARIFSSCSASLSYAESITGAGWSEMVYVHGKDRDVSLL
jgi:hypothetical protein